MNTSVASFPADSFLFVFLLNITTILNWANISYQNLAKMFVGLRIEGTVFIDGSRPCIYDSWKSWVAHEGMS